MEIGNYVAAHFHVYLGECEKMVYFEKLLKRIIVLHGQGIKGPTNKKILEQEGLPGTRAGIHTFRTRFKCVRH